MPTIDEILDNIREYTIPQLAEFIHQGIIDREDLNIPSFAASKRKELDTFLAKTQDIEEEDRTPNVDDEAEWQKALSLDTIEAYSHYLEITDNGKHADEARQRISELTKPKGPSGEGGIGPTEFEVLIRKLSNRPSPSDTAAVQLIKDHVKKNGVGKLLEEIKGNPNLLSAGTIRFLYEDGFFSEEQLIDLFPKDFIRAMIELPPAPQSLVQPTQLENISSPCTEVYFWGISQSGKSCMLAALLSVAKSGEFGIWKPQDCQGYDYMIKLANLMSANKVTPVAPGNAIGTFYDMSFQFITEYQTSGFFGKKHTRNYVHPITFIDLAGGMLNLMFRFIANRDSLSDNDKSKLMSMTQIINGKRGQNRKIHFFVLEYGAEEYISAEKVNQDALLTAAAQYIEDERIFNRDTDAIYFVITKADKAKKHGKELSDELQRYIQAHYNGFYKMLRYICKKNEITFGVIPFTIGEVMMQSYCKLNPSSAITVLNKIMERTFSIDESKIGKIKKGLTQ